MVYIVCTIGNESYELGLDPSNGHELISITRSSLYHSTPEFVTYAQCGPFVRARIDERIRYYHTKELPKRIANGSK